MAQFSIQFTGIIANFNGPKIDYVSSYIPTKTIELHWITCFHISIAHLLLN